MTATNSLRCCRRASFAAALLVLMARTGHAGAQGVTADDLGRDLPIAVVVPPSAGEGESVRAQLESRLAQLLTGTGLAAVDGEARLVLYPKLVVLRDERTDGLLRNQNVVKVDLTLYLKNVSDKVLFASMSRSLAGAGPTRDAALVNAVSSMRGDDPEVRAFAQDARRKVIDYYVRGCDRVIADGLAAARSADLPRALAVLLGVPAEAEACHRRASAEAARIFAAHQRQDCEARVRRARALVATNKFEDAVVQLEAVDVSSSCAADAESLISHIEREVDASAAVKLSLERHRAETKTVKGTLGSPAAVQKRQSTLMRAEAAVFFNRKTAREYDPEIFR